MEQIVNNSAGQWPSLFLHVVGGQHMAPDLDIRQYNT